MKLEEQQKMRAGRKKRLKTEEELSQKQFKCSYCDMRRDGKHKDYCPTQF